MNKQIGTLPLSPPINLLEERKWLLAVTSFEATNSVFNITEENKKFSITTPGQSIVENSEEPINKLNETLEVRSQNDVELHVKEFEKTSFSIEKENSGYNLAGFDHF